MIRSSDVRRNEEKQKEKQTTQQQTDQEEEEEDDDDQCEQQGDSNRPKRNPFCSRCRNHGKSAQVKGHKRHCEYRDCQCEGCKLVECRQIVSAAQIKRRRYQKQDEECGRRIEISPPVLTREPNSDPAALIAKTLIGSASAKTAITGLHHHQLHHHLPTICSPSNPYSASLSSNLDTNHHLHHNGNNNSNNDHHNQLHGAHLNLNLNMNHQNLHQAPKGAVEDSPLSNALHLFHFPNSVLSAAAAASIGSHVYPSSLVSATSQPAVASVINSPSLPSIREQITLVDEIHQACGPLAIYAWLRAERFNLQKVRDLIEISRTSYSNLVDLKSKYRLNNHHSYNSNVNINSNGGCGRDNNSDMQRSSNKSPITTFPSLSSTTTTMSSSPLYTTVSSYNNEGISCSNTNNYINSNNATVTTGANHNMSLGTTLNSFPMTTAQSLLWPNLKLTTTGTAAVTHPHHLLPHFIHHPFVTHQIYQQQQQQQMSPASTVTNSSSSASSSSKVS